MWIKFWDFLVCFANDKLLYCTYCKQEQVFTDKGWFWECTKCRQKIEKSK